MYEARKVANFVLANYDAVRFDVTNLRLNKLLYFMHGWALVDDAKGLIRNHFEAWKLGPVVPSVYDEFKRHGDQPISALAHYLDYATGAHRPIPIDDIASNHSRLIQQVFEYYAPRSTSQLVALSHENDGAWTAALRAARGGNVNVRIPNNLIRENFLLMSGPGRRH